MADDPTTTAARWLDWNGAAVARFIGPRRLLNFWRLRIHTEDGIRVEFYRTRRGTVITSVTSPRGEGEQ